MESSTIKFEDEMEAFMGRMMRSLEQGSGKASGKSSFSDRSLLVSIHQLWCPVTEATLQQVFALYGNVEKISILNNDRNGFQALVRFDSILQSILAKQALHGRCIYDGCCILDLRFPDEELVMQHDENPKAATESLIDEVSDLEVPISFDNAVYEISTVDSSGEFNDGINSAINDGSGGKMEELCSVKCVVKENFNANEVFEKMARKQDKMCDELVGIDFVFPKEILEMNFNFGWLVRTFLTGMYMKWKQMYFALYVFLECFERSDCNKFQIAFDPGGVVRVFIVGACVHRQKEVIVLKASTGEICLRPEDYFLTISTELWRSMLYQGAVVIVDTEWPTLDEVHYFNDVERNVILEEISMNSMVKHSMLQEVVRDLKLLSSQDKWLKKLFKQMVGDMCSNDDADVLHKMARNRLFMRANIKEFLQSNSQAKLIPRAHNGFNVMREASKVIFINFVKKGFAIKSDALVKLDLFGAFGVKQLFYCYGLVAKVFIGLIVRYAIIHALEWYIRKVTAIKAYKEMNIHVDVIVVWGSMLVDPYQQLMLHFVLVLKLIGYGIEVRTHEDSSVQCIIAYDHLPPRPPPQPRPFRSKDAAMVFSDKIL